MQEADDKIISEQAWQGWFRFMARTAVYFAWIENRDVALGSGCALKTRAGRTFVLTAAHIVDDLLQATPPRFMGWLAIEEGVPFEPQWIWRHPELDVAIVLPPAAVRERLAVVAEPLDLVAERYEPQADDKHVVIGHPYDTRRKVPDGFAVASFSWLCDESTVPRRLDDGRIEFPWVESGAPLHRMDDGATVGRSAPERPGGMSGGPLWMHRAMVDPATNYWSPQAASRLVAVQTSWYPGRRQLVLEPVERWRAWFVDAVREIDALPA